MPFIRIEGEEGLFFVPEDEKKKKYPCSDCYSCQWCSDERCKLCLQKKCAVCGKRDGNNEPGKTE